MPVTQRLGYLLKHAQLRFAGLSAVAMQPFEIDGRQLAVLSVLGEAVQQSQQDVARKLGVDRTTMMAMLDELEKRRLVDRFTSPDDRRKNVVVLTVSGWETMEQAGKARNDAEEEFLAALSDDEAATFRRLLGMVVQTPES
jgi:DNA-binding MarR family transcriptional regulator